MLKTIDIYPIGFSVYPELRYLGFVLKDKEWEFIQNIIPNDSYAQSLMLKFHFGENVFNAY